MRFFKNTMQDFTGSLVKQDEFDQRKRIMNILNIIKQNQKINLHNCDGGLYVGLGGIAYMFLKLSETSMFTNDKENLLNEAYQYLKVALEYIKQPNIMKDKKNTTAFLLGTVGIIAVNSVYNHMKGNLKESKEILETYIELGKFCLPVNFLPQGGDELLVGRAGYLCGGLWLQKKLGYSTNLQNMLHNVADSILQSGRQYAKKYKSPCPLMYSYHGVEYLGAAHGLSSILQMLLALPKWLSEQPQAESDIHLSVDFLLSLQTAIGNFPAGTDEIGSQVRHPDNELVHWCHGAPGVIYLMAQAYLKWKDLRYLSSCEKSGELIWTCGLLKKGPGICHGIGGNGYAFLLLYQLTHNPKYLFRAQQFAEFLFTEEFKQARTPDSPYSLFEGWAGTVCFLADLFQPYKAAFPFFDLIPY